MTVIAQFGRSRSGPVWPLILILLCSCACSHPGGGPSDQSSLQNDHQAPFRQSDTAPVANPTTALAASETVSNGSENNPPFHDSESLPAGTLLSVRLTNPVYAENSILSTSFHGVLTRPVVIDGNTVIPMGATVNGLVESARASQVKPNRGYVRLALQSVEVGGSEIPLRTASLFAPQAPAPGSAPSLIRLEKGRQLVFRVSEPAYTPTRQAQK